MSPSKGACNVLAPSGLKPGPSKPLNSGVRRLGEHHAVSKILAWLRRRCGLVPPEEHITKLRAAGLIVELRFRATRAFEVAEFEDEGRHLFLELDDSSVLYLCGQYLYDHGADAAGPEDADPHTFPATEFTLVRHRAQDYVCQILPSGRKLPPEAICPHYAREDYALGLVPDDCDIITAFTFDQLLENKGRLL